jgi:hypothetical protein
MTVVILRPLLVLVLLLVLVPAGGAEPAAGHLLGEGTKEGAVTEQLQEAPPRAQGGPGWDTYRGRCDVPLDAQGRQDAVDAARLLSDVGLTAVYTGPLRRTIATAQIVLLAAAFAGAVSVGAAVARAPLPALLGMAATRLTERHSR